MKGPSCAIQLIPVGMSLETQCILCVRNSVPKYCVFIRVKYLRSPDQEVLVACGGGEQF